jgi:outer membrane protein assembly factor BamB
MKNPRLICFLVSIFALASAAEASLLSLAKDNGPNRGIVAVMDSGGTEAGAIVELAQGTELLVYVQCNSRDRAARIRSAIAKAGLLAKRVAVDHGKGLIELADNTADLVISERGAKKNQELLRVLRPLGVALVGGRKLVKPVPAGADDWSHPYHGPDNNPNSDDQLVRGDFRTQFIGYPMFSPMPQQTVSAGGVLFKAFGHIAHKANQNEVLNTLMAVNAYNGTILWRRPLPKGFMIHRNTMIATEDALYMGDDESCKVFDAQTGKIREEILAPKGITDGPVWKWMAMRDGVLYALIGNTEVKVDTQKSERAGLGHWPWGMWKGHDYKDPKSAFGFGRTLVAIDLKTKKVKWHFKSEDYLDARAVVMNRDSFFGYSPDHSLTRVKVTDGKLVWRTTEKDLLKAIDGNLKAQHYTTGYSTSCYVKCNDDYLFFAGPQRARLVTVKTKDGTVAWTHAPGNLQLVLRPDAVYAAGPQRSIGGRLDYATGKVLEEFPGRRACTRATGCADSVFFRASGGTVRLMTGDSQSKAQHIDPMRPPCQDGVIVANGHLYWGPWMCGCQLSLYGNIALGPAREQVLFTPIRSGATPPEQAHEIVSTGSVKSLKAGRGDWPVYRGDNARSDVTDRKIADKLTEAWETSVTDGALPTAPVVAGGMVFLADRSGAVYAFDRNGKKVWVSYTAGPVYYPPVIAHDRAYVGSADGRVYAFEAKTGRLLWSHRVGPAQRRVAVFDNLISTWPVSGGVVVAGGHVYAAAGIAHYDGTFVVKLDAKTGKLKARNDSSGVLGTESNNGISMQGNLRIEDGELRFLAGGVYETARFDLDMLKCLNDPVEQITSQFRTAFYPYYPSYGKYVSLDYQCADGCTLNHDASYEGSKFTNLVLEEPPAAGIVRPNKEAARWLLPRNVGKDRKPLLKAKWRDQENRRFTSFVVAGDRLLAAGHPAARPGAAFLSLTDIASGKDVWKIELPALPVKGGTAVAGDGRIYASLENGSLVCYQP